MNITELSPANIINESPALAVGLVAVGVISTAIAVRQNKINSPLRTISRAIAFAVIVVVIFMMWFYRHPQNTIRTDLSPGDVISPAHGTVYEILPVTKNIQKDSSLTDTSSTTIPVQYTHISIFLSPADVHVQYIPTESTFVKTTYDATGKFELAYEMNKSNDNEKAITELLPNTGSKDIYPIFVTQIAGFLVRRINTKKFAVGSQLKPGQELGMIKFGSRVDIELPTDQYEILVKEGQYLYGSKTLLAKLL